MRALEEGAHADTAVDLAQGFALKRCVGLLAGLLAAEETRARASWGGLLDALLEVSHYF